MKKYRSIILICILLFLVGIFIHPRKVIYEPKIIGKVTDEIGSPIEKATVSRIEENHWENKEFGYYESEEFVSETVITDRNGNFVLNEKSKIDWIHNIPFVLPRAYCHSEFEVSKKGFKTYRTEFDDYNVYNENLNACKGIEFKPRIKLEKL